MQAFTHQNRVKCLLMTVAARHLSDTAIGNLKEVFHFVVSPLLWVLYGWMVQCLWVFRFVVVCFGRRVSYFVVSSLRGYGKGLWFGPVLESAG